MIRANDSISKHYMQRLEIRKLQFLSVIHHLIKKEILRPEYLPDEYDSLYHRIQVYSDFYFSALIISGKKLGEHCIEDYLKEIRYAIYPYLTDKGKREILIK